MRRPWNRTRGRRCDGTIASKIIQIVVDDFFCCKGVHTIEVRICNGVVELAVDSNPVAGLCDVALLGVFLHRESRRVRRVVGGEVVEWSLTFVVEVNWLRL